MIRNPHCLLSIAMASCRVLFGDTGCDQLKQQMDERRALESQAHALQQAASVWVEYAMEAETGDVPHEFRDPKVIRDACRGALVALSPGLEAHPADLGAMTESCVPRLTRSGARAQVLKDVKTMHNNIVQATDRVKGALRSLTPMPDLQKRWNALRCDDNNQWQQLIGRWRNTKGTLVLDFVDTGRGIEGRVVKPMPDWPPNIAPGTVFFRSSVVAGETPSDRMKGTVLEGSFRNFPQGKDCPNLAREPKYDAGTIEIGPGTLTLHQNGRYYGASTCRWADKMFTVDTAMTPAQ